MPFTSTGPMLSNNKLNFTCPERGPGRVPGHRSAARHEVPGVHPYPLYLDLNWTNKTQTVLPPATR